jgi:hypothetical protein
LRVETRQGFVLPKKDNLSLVEMPILGIDNTAAHQLATKAILEEAGYLEHQGSQLYYVLHHSDGDCRAGALMAGPFGPRRNGTYISWVRWARFLASHGYEVLRFDYRGVGESSGRFETMCISAWLDDLRLCGAMLKSRIGGRPLLLHGLEFGGILAAKAHTEGIGDALLLWSPPTSAREALLEQLRLNVIGEYAQKKGRQKISREDFIKELEAGRCAEVRGYLWSPELWRDSVDFSLDVHADHSNGDGAIPTNGRVRSVQVEPFLKGMPMEQYDQKRPVSRIRPLLNPNLKSFFERERAWICQSLDNVCVSSNARNPAN